MSEQAKSSRTATALTWFAWAVLGLAVILGLMVASVRNPESQAKAADRDAIARCVQAREDELSDLATRRFMRQACLQMDQAFRRKWGIESREL